MELSNMWLQNKLEDFVNGIDSQNVLREISHDVNSGKIKLLDVVEALGIPLTSKDTAVRLKATSLLVDVVSQVPSTLLIEGEVTSLVRFYCSRLDDHHSLTPIILNGLATLARHPLLTSDNVVHMLRAIFQNVTVSTLVRGDRMVVYKIFEQLLDAKLEDVKILGSEFVVGFIEVISSEADPRNLVCVFKLFHQVAHNFVLDVLAEDLFEAVACYFPIDFSPPPDNVDGITKEQLVVDLQECFAASPSFGKFCLPLLLEKLGSSVTSAKADSLNALIVCCPIYSCESLMEHGNAFWSHIRSEVFSIRKELEGLCLEALKTLTKALSQDISCLDEFLADVYRDCLKYLEEPEQPIFQSTSKLIVTVCEATSESSCRVLNTTIPIILREFKLNPQLSRRENLLELVLFLIKAARNAGLSRDGKNPLAGHKEELYQLLTSLLSDASPKIQKISILGLTGLMAVPSLLNSEEIHQIAKCFLLLAYSETDKTVRDECIAAMTFLATDYTSVVSSFVLPDLFDRLLKRGDITQEVDSTSLFVSMELLVGVSVCLDVVHQTVPAFIEFLNRLHQNGGNESTLAEATKCVHSLESIVSSNLSSSKCLEFFSSSLLSQCEILLLKGCLSDSSSSSFVQNVDIIRGLSAIVRHIIQKSATSEVKSFINNLTKLFIHGEIEHLSSHPDLWNVQLTTFKTDALKEQPGLLELLVAALCSLENQEIIPESDELMSKLQSVAVDCDDEVSSLAACKCFAGLVNKAPQDSRLDSFLQKVEWDLMKFFGEDSIADDSLRRRAVVLWSWLTKALVLSNNKHQTTFANQLVDMLTSECLAEGSADGFRIVLTEYEDVLCPDSHAVSTLMHKQRFFVLVIRRLLDGYHASGDAQSPYYLLALSYLIQTVPKQALIPELPLLMPVFVRSLSLEDDRIWNPTLEVIADLISNNAEFVSKYIDDILPRLLLLTRFKPKMSIRLSALNCIHLICLKLPKQQILRHTDAVVRQLQLAMDDDKRRVRQKVAETKMDWSMTELMDA